MKTIILTNTAFKQMSAEFLEKHKGEKHTTEEWSDILFECSLFHQGWKILRFETEAGALTYMKAVSDCKYFLSHGMYELVVIPYEQIID